MRFNGLNIYIICSILTKEYFEFQSEKDIVIYFVCN